jgi:hypothetical protein
VLRGDADPRLLDDYEPERRAVGRLTAAQALLRVDGRRAEAPLEDRPLLSEAAVAISYRYRVVGDAEAGLSSADEPSHRRRPQHVERHSGRGRVGRSTPLTVRTTDRTVGGFVCDDTVKTNG